MLFSECVCAGVCVCVRVCVCVCMYEREGKKQERVERFFHKFPLLEVVGLPLILEGISQNLKQSWSIVCDNYDSASDIIGCTQTPPSGLTLSGHLS